MEKNKGLTSTVFLVIFLIITLLSFLLLPILFSLILFTLMLFPVLLYITLGKLTKRWFVSILLTMLIQFILIASLGYWVYSDTTSLINNAQSQPKYILYRDGNKIPFGIQIMGDLNFNNPKDSFKSLGNEGIKNILNAIDNKDKFVVIIKKEFFNALPETISIKMENTNITIPKSEALAILSSPNPENIVLKYAADSLEGLSQLPPEMQEQIKRGNIPDELRQLMQSQNIDSSTIKLGVLAVLTQKIVQQEGIEHVFRELSNNNIDVKPFYIGIWVVKHIPLEFAKPYLPADIQREINNFKLG